MMSTQTFAASSLSLQPRVPLAQAGPPDSLGSQAAAAEGQPAGPGGAPGQQAPPSLFGGGFLPILLGFFFLMLIMSTMGQRKEKKKRAKTLASLSRHDKVQTIGGIIGTVAELRDTEVVLKVDESTNTKIRIARSAVQSVLKKSGAAGSSEPPVEDAAPPELANA